MEALGTQGLAAVLLTDAVAFTRKVSRSESTYLQILGEHLQIIQRICLRHTGEVLKNTGDGLLVYFPSIHQALSAAKEFQTELSSFDRDKSFQHRAAIHVGDIYRTQGDILGSGVNVTSRLMRACEPGRICVSQTVHELVGDMNSDFTIRPVRGLLDDFENNIKAYHYCSRGFRGRKIPPSIAWLAAGFLALGTVNLVLPTFLGWDVLWVADYERAFLLLLLASIAAIHYPCGAVAVACSLQMSRKPWKKPPLFRIALSLLLYAPVASIGLLQFVESKRLFAMRDHWTSICTGLFALTAVFVLGGVLRRPWSIFLAAIFLFSAPSCGRAQLGTPLDQFEDRWDSPVQQGSDNNGAWRVYRKGKKEVRIWLDSSTQRILRMRYRCATFDDCWREVIRNQNGALWWEREYSDPSTPAIHRVVSTQWLRRPALGTLPTARATIEYELTSIFLFPPLCFFYRFLHDIDRPWQLEIFPYTALASPKSSWPFASTTTFESR